MSQPATSAPARRVAITAIGVVSPLGCDAAENTANLKSGRDAVTPVTVFDTSKCRSKTAGQVRADWRFSRAADDWHRASHFLAAAAAEAKAGDPAFRPE